MEAVCRGLERPVSLDTSVLSPSFCTIYSVQEANFRTVQHQDTGSTCPPGLLGHVLHRTGWSLC